MTAKEELKKLYSSRIVDFKKVKESFPDDDLAGPILISPNELYYKQKNHLLIVGQQTNDWTCDHDNIDEQLKTYENFNLGINYYSCPFWNITRKIELALGNDKYSCVWTNINKFDLDADRPYGDYEKEISTLDSILINEIEILKPDICIFFTGPSFDERIRTIFNEVQFIDIDDRDKRRLCGLKHEKLPKLTFRTYHPKYLRIKHLEDDFIEFMSKFK